MVILRPFFVLPAVLRPNDYNFFCLSISSVTVCVSDVVNDSARKLISAEPDRNSRRGTLATGQSVS